SRPLLDKARPLRRPIPLSFAHPGGLHDKPAAFTEALRKGFTNQRVLRLLECCVGQAWFREPPTHGETLDRTELFDMCLLLADREQVRRWMVSRVRQLTELYGGELAAKALERALAPKLTLAEEVTVVEFVELALAQDSESDEPLSESITSRLFKSLVIGATTSADYQAELDDLMKGPLERQSQPGRPSLAAE
ncbi:MAG: hypothetical protein RLZZ450_4381, partial [Pseudomonadota bacterium]